MQKARLSGLIAMVATAVIVDGQRTIIQPGQALPELPEHDEKELVANGAALDPGAQADSDKARQQEEQFAQQEFQKARERAMDAQASITPPAAPDADAAAPAPAAPDADAAAPAPAAPDADAAAPAPAAPDADAAAPAPAASKAAGKSAGKK